MRHFSLQVLTILLLPILYFNGKKIRRSVPKLPEAEGPHGVSGDQFSKKIKLVTVGESTIAGVGAASHKIGFTGTLSDELSEALSTKIEWQVLARSGYTAKQVKYKLIPKIPAADLIVIGLGGNDAFTLNSPGRWKTTTREIIQTLRISHPDTPIFFTNMPPIKSFPAFTAPIKWTIGNWVELLGQGLAEVCAAFPNVYYNEELITLPVWCKRHHIKGDVSQFFSDGVHPSELTYQVWARDYAAFILKSGANLF